MPGPSAPPTVSVDAAVFVHLAPDPVGDAEKEWQWLAGLEASLTEAVERAWAGEVEGLDLIGDEWVLSAHGPCVDALWAAMSKVLVSWPLPVNSYALQRRGAPGAPEQRVAIGGADTEPVPALSPPASTWRPVSEQGLLAALATLTA